MELNLSMDDIAVVGGDSRAFVSIVNEHHYFEQIRAQQFSYRGVEIAGFMMGEQKMLCLPQIYELFLKQLVGGLHTIYTKLKRLRIHPLICNVEQVRALRMAGAIQCGVNRCKLINMEDLDTLLMDCEDTSTRPGRPSKRILLNPDFNLLNNNFMITPNISPLNLLSATSSCASEAPSTSTTQKFDFFPMANQNFMVQQLIATAVNHQLEGIHKPQSTPPTVSSKSFDFPGLTTNSLKAPTECQTGQTKSEEWLQKEKPKGTKIEEPSSQSSNDSSEEKALDSGDSSMKPSDNSETDTSFYREKSMSANDQDSGTGSGGSGSGQSNSPQNNQNIVNSVVGLIDAAQLTLKKQGEQLSDLMTQIQNEIKDMSKRDRISRLELYAERQKSAHYHRRYIAMKYMRHQCHHHHRRFKKRMHGESNDKDNNSNSNSNDKNSGYSNGTEEAES